MPGSGRRLVRAGVPCLYAATCIGTSTKPRYSEELAYFRSQGLSRLKRVEVAQLCADCSLYTVVTGRGGRGDELPQGVALALMMREQHLRISALVDAHRPR